MSNKNTVFRPTPSETKADSVTRIVKGMIAADTSARQSKTERLRAARLDRDASAKTEAEAAPKKKPKKAPSKP
ncbi:hypothetical protein [Palleronia sp. LCG004]|uniref:hypothetical protein n=1 Tax=Palleronia sp. LCG004 TaxID=3079304 RepID=UPI002943ABE1|nr:hypothetical protein [Palleronia sp. LCG004]WOI57969.1 hypothetical protein RVY76_15310 [Palleronia sp. LCG004]